MDPNVAASSGQLAANTIDESTKPNATPPIQQRKQQHNISIEHVNDVLVKSKKDTISIPCTAEFLFTGKFYSLNKEPLTRAFIGEDFLFRIDLEVKSVPIDILDMFLISVSIVDVQRLPLRISYVKIKFYFPGLQYIGETVQSSSTQIRSNVCKGRKSA